MQLQSFSTVKVCVCVSLPGGGSGAGVSAAAGAAGELPAAGGRQTQPACCCPPPGHTAAGVLAAVSLSHVQGNCTQTCLNLDIVRLLPAG